VDEATRLARAPARAMTAGQTFKIIGEAFEAVRVQALISEGSPYSEGAGPERLAAYGESRFTMLKPALEHMLGPPCSVGAALAAAKRACLD
jgi:hypothetical protein